MPYPSNPLLVFLTLAGKRESICARTYIFPQTGAKHHTTSKFGQSLSERDLSMVLFTFFLCIILLFLSICLLFFQHSLDIYPAFLLGNFFLLYLLFFPDYLEYLKNGIDSLPSKMHLPQNPVDNMRVFNTRYALMM